MTEMVVTGFVVVKHSKKGAQDVYKHVSRHYSVRESAEAFKALAEKGARADERFYVSDVMGADNVT